MGNSIIPKIYKRKLSEEENAGYIWGLYSLFSFRFRYLSIWFGEDGLNLQCLHNVVGR
nr:MAG TPA: hypothetical protein [Caudoviricetes sp.]